MLHITAELQGLRHSQRSSNLLYLLFLMRLHMHQDEYEKFFYMMEDLHLNYPLLC
jgi:hypothetical protein